MYVCTTTLSKAGYINPVTQASPWAQVLLCGPEEPRGIQIDKLFKSVQRNGPERLAKVHTCTEQGKRLLWLTLSPCSVLALVLGRQALELLGPGKLRKCSCIYLCGLALRVKPSSSSHIAQWMMFGQETFFHCIPMPELTTVLSYVLT
jgi:hypothetical protein